MAAVKLWGDEDPVCMQFALSEPSPFMQHIVIILVHYCYNTEILRLLLLTSIC